MRLPLLLLVLLTACAAPSHYAQGVPVRPPPAPALRPGHGAPVVGQPGTGAAPVPRSPNSRVLPPSTEPGLWSADRPRAALEYQLPSVLGFGPPSRVSNAEVTCIGAHAYLSCLVTLYTNATKDADVKDLTLALYRYQKRLDPEMEKVCKGVDRRRSDLAALLRSVETAWKNSLQTWREGR